MRGDELRLADILQAVERIRSFTAPGRESFYSDLKTQEAVAFEILKIGETAHRVSPSFRKAHRSVPWNRIVALRNEVVHEYFRVDLDTLWAFVTDEIDGLEKSLKR